MAVFRNTGGGTERAGKKIHAAVIIIIAGADGSVRIATAQHLEIGRRRFVLHIRACRFIPSDDEACALGQHQIEVAISIAI